MYSYMIYSREILFFSRKSSKLQFSISTCGTYETGVSTCVGILSEIARLTRYVTFSRRRTYMSKPKMTGLACVDWHFVGTRKTARRSSVTRRAGSGDGRAKNKTKTARARPRGGARRGPRVHGNKDARA